MCMYLLSESGVCLFIIYYTSQEGLSKVGPQADRTAHAQALFAAEERAKMSKKNLWKDYIEPVTQEESEDGEPDVKEEIATSEDSQTLSDEKNDFEKVFFFTVCNYDLVSIVHPESFQTFCTRMCSNALSTHTQNMIYILHALEFVCIHTSAYIYAFAPVRAWEYT